MKKIHVITGFLAVLLLASLTTFAQSQSRKDLLKEIEAKRQELDALEQTLLEPAEEDRLQHADFLRAPNTGLIRLLPRERYDSKSYQTGGRVTLTTGSFSRPQVADLPQGQGSPEDTSSVRPNLDYLPRENYQTSGGKTVRGVRLSVNGGGAYYSFTRKTHEYGQGSDIELTQGHLQTGFAGADYGLMVDLGDVPLESVDIASREANVLAAYKPASRMEQARQEYRRLTQGAEVDGLRVARRLPMQTGSTYLLRSLNYTRADVLVAFKVVRVDSDGSAIILWKLLKKYSPPQLAKN